MIVLMSKSHHEYSPGHSIVDKALYIFDGTIREDEKYFYIYTHGAEIPEIYSKEEWVHETA